MFETISLVKRHMLRFLRDKTAVFFSFLSVIILLALYFLFIGRSYTSYDAMSAIHDESLKSFLVVSMMMGGVLVINSMSLSLGMMGNIIEDLDNHSLDAFLVTPIKRNRIIISYYIAANIVTIILSFAMWLFTFLYAGLALNYWYTLDVFLKTTGLLVFYSFISTSIMIYITTLLKSVNAFGTLSGVLGTFVGFVSGIYMPLSILGSAMTKFASLVPFTHMTILLKSILLEQPMAILSGYVNNDTIMAEIRADYGLNQIGILNIDISLPWIFVLIILFSILMLFLALKNMTKKINR
ncbi:MAG: ABC transporter permease [Acholeplasmataceae bacterium]